MTLETFTKIIVTLQEKLEQDARAYALGLDTTSYNENLYKHVINPLLLESFGGNGLDWIDWYVYEKTSLIAKTPPLQAFDEYNNEICQDIPSLFKTVQALKKLEKPIEKEEKNNSL